MASIDRTDRWHVAHRPSRPSCADDPTIALVVGGQRVSRCARLRVRDQSAADLQIAGWRTLNPQVVQTRVEADHDHLITRAITQVEQAILAAVAK